MLFLYLCDTLFLPLLQLTGGMALYVTLAAMVKEEPLGQNLVGIVSGGNVDITKIS